MPRPRACRCRRRSNACRASSRRPRASLPPSNEIAMEAETQAEPKIDIHRGLKGVYFDRSRVCDIDGRGGQLWYRGYSIHDLAEHSTFEETCYLLFHGELPSTAELAAFSSELRAAGSLAAPIHD